MKTDHIKCYDDLKQELQDAKHNLVALNENIRRIVGRNPKDFRNDKHKSPQDQKRKDIDRQIKRNNEFSKVKRHNQDAKSVFNRLSAPVSRISDDDFKPRLNSRVIRELPTRQEVVAAQCTDSESRARNRRMFGSLLGTLHKFCQEESRLKQKEDKKAQIEKKLEEQEMQERQTIKREREALFIDRRRKQLEIKRLELKMSRLKDFECWESSIKHFKNHIRTKTKPYIYYKPKIMSKKTEALLAEHQTQLDIIIKAKLESVNKELTEIECDLRDHDIEIEENVVATPGITIDVNYIDEQSKSPNDRYESGNVSIHSEVTVKKGDVEHKENNSKNSEEPLLNSSVVLIKSSPKD